ncbi:hypothetical protein RFI_36577 [Reticulomyxa filosa]|uniref:Uncharacterized protein n=1 Tax=Reticulomyxa filosa TaxID=46433 RepID=X6LFX4_RETFI|nr:hypothetical protein RFI_36577 [Reticulomyxa filosa]|eukprot:ETO00863.1 hypothetical protein RFI_36577 [Reticulomyxa filosa]
MDLKQQDIDKRNILSSESYQQFIQSSVKYSIAKDHVSPPYNAKDMSREHCNRRSQDQEQKEGANENIQDFSIKETSIRILRFLDEEERGNDYQKGLNFHIWNNNPTYTNFFCKSK